MTDLSKPEPIKNQCSAHKKTGERCQKPPINGTTVCRFHGGAAPQVKAKAKRRLEEAADRMAKELLRIASYGDDERTKLAAIKDALDRAGLGAKAEVAVEMKPWQVVFDSVTAGPKTPGKRAAHADDEPRARENDDIVDAELVHTCAGCGRTPPEGQEEPPEGWPDYCRTCRAAAEDSAPADTDKGSVTDTEPTDWWDKGGYAPGTGPDPHRGKRPIDAPEPPPPPTAEELAADHAAASARAHERAVAEVARVNRAAGVWKQPRRPVRREGDDGLRRDGRGEFGP